MPMKACCPFHEERTPSFYVYKDHFWCYGKCNSGGSVIDFEARRQNLSIVDSARSLCIEYNIVVSQEESDRYEKSEKRRKEKSDMLSALPTIGSARPELVRYLREERKLSDQTIQDLGITFATRENSIVVPINDKFGRIVAFARRDLDYAVKGGPKWKNDAADEIYDKKSILYNFDRARRFLSQDQHLILCESYMCCAALWEAGIKTGVAYCSSKVTKEQAEEIRALGGLGMVVLFAACNDRTAQDKLLVNRTVIHSAVPEAHIRAVVIPDGSKDLNDVLINHGKDALVKIVRESIPMDRYLLDQVLASEPVVELQYRRAKAMVAIAENPLSQKDLISYLAKKWSKDEAIVDHYMTGKGGEAVASISFDNIGSLITKYEEYTRTIDSQRVNTGWAPYDKLTRGMKPGDVWQLIAAAGTGKTTFAEQLMMSIGETQPDVPMIFYSLEQKSLMVFERFMQMAGEMDGGEVERWMVAGNDAQNSKIFSAAQSLSAKLKNLLVCDQGGLNLKMIEENTRGAGFAYFGRPVSVIFIDYLGYLHGDGNSIYEQVSYLAREQKEVAKRLNCRIVSLHQTTKAGKPGVAIDDSHARDSSAVRDSADVLIGAWRPELEEGLVDAKKKELEGVWRSKILKNRYGPAHCIVDFEFVPRYLKLFPADPRKRAEIAARAVAQPITLPPAPGLEGPDGKERASGS